jgi:hypothetical protein
MRHERYCRRLGSRVGFDAVVAHSSETMMPTSHDATERRPAIWPWLLMPLVVLMLFFTLKRFHTINASGDAEARTSTSVTAEQ